MVTKEEKRGGNHEDVDPYFLEMPAFVEVDQKFHFASQPYTIVFQIWPHAFAPFLASEYSCPQHMETSSPTLL